MLKKIVAGAVIVTMTGCYGGFQATKAVHQFNHDIHPNKFVQEAAFLAMVIIPVYGVATLIDAVLLNSIEFWTGSNPMADAGKQQRVDGQDGSYAMTTIKADGTMDLTVVEANGQRHFMNLERAGNDVIARDLAGAIVAKRTVSDVTQVALAQ